MVKLAYRFLPKRPDGRFERTSRYTIVANTRLEIGQEVELPAYGYVAWRVIEIQPSAGPLRGASETDGTSLELVGTAVCEGVRRPQG